MKKKSFQFSVMALAATSFIALSTASSSAQAAQATFGPAPVGLAFSEDTATIDTSPFTIGPAPATTTTASLGGGSMGWDSNDISRIRQHDALSELSHRCG
jgi:opacity protein-like surface antigen